MGDQIRRQGQSISSESVKQLSEIEKNFQSMIDEVTKVVEDRKLFRDQTITKTVHVAGDPSYRSRVTSQADNYDYQGGAGIPTQTQSYQPSSSIELVFPDGTQERAAPYRASAQSTDSLMGGTGSMGGTRSRS